MDTPIFSRTVGRGRHVPRVGLRFGVRVPLAGADATRRYTAIYAPPPAPLSESVLPSQFDGASRAHAMVDFGPGPVRTDLLILDNSAYLALRPPMPAGPRIYRIDDPRSVVLVLADRRLAFAWSALIEWTGPSLDKLRALKLAETRATFARGDDAPSFAPETATAPERFLDTLRPGAHRRRRQHAARRSPNPRCEPRTAICATCMATRLAAISPRLGYRDEARQLLEAALAGNRRKDEWQQAEFAMVTISLATKLNNSGDHAAALTLYDTLGQMESSYAMNAGVNRAAILAETGQYAEALALIERSYAAYAAAADGKYGRGNER